jgi:hypothetical protein
LGQLPSLTSPTPVYPRSNLERPIGECAGKKAKERLSPKAFEFLVASLEGDEKKTAKLRTELSVTEAMAADIFMVSGSAQCAQELGAQ